MGVLAGAIVVSRVLARSGVGLVIAALSRSGVGFVIGVLARSGVDLVIAALPRGPAPVPIVPRIAAQLTIVANRQASGVPIM